MGGSYGGYMTMAAITEHPELWSAAVNIVGIVNFVTFLERTGSYRRALREAEYGSLEHDRAFLERISPIHKVDRIALPADGRARRERPARAGQRGRAGRRGAARAGRRGRLPALRGRGPRHHAAAEPPRLLPADRGVPRDGTSALADGTRPRRRPGAHRGTRLAHARAARRRARRGVRPRDLAEARVPAAHRQLQVPRRDERGGTAARPAPRASSASRAATTRRPSRAPRARRASAASP